MQSDVSENKTRALLTAVLGLARSVFIVKKYSVHVVCMHVCLYLSSSLDQMRMTPLYAIILGVLTTDEDLGILFWSRRTQFHTC